MIMGKRGWRCCARQDRRDGGSPKILSKFLALFLLGIWGDASPPDWRVMEGNVPEASGGFFETEAV